MEVEKSLIKSQGFLKSAKVSLGADEPDACDCLCYHAVFWTTMVLLAHVGVKKVKWKHDELRQVFGLECIKRYKICPPEFGEWLKELYFLRSDAVYKLEPSNREESRTSPKESDRVRPKGYGGVPKMRRNKTKDGLRKFLDEVCQLIQQNLEPKAQITVIPHRIYETGDAHIEVLLPYRQWTRKADKIADAVYNGKLRLSMVMTLVSLSEL